MMQVREGKIPNEYIPLEEMPLGPKAASGASTVSSAATTARIVAIVALVLAIAAVGVGVAVYFIPRMTTPSPVSPSTASPTAPPAPVSAPFDNGTLVELISFLRYDVDSNATFIRQINTSLVFSQISNAESIMSLNQSIEELSNTLRQLQIATNSTEALNFVTSIEQQLDNVLRNFTAITAKIQQLNDSDSVLSNLISNLTQQLNAQITSISNQISSVIQQSYVNDTLLWQRVDQLSANTSTLSSVVNQLVANDSKQTTAIQQLTNDVLYLNALLQLSMSNHSQSTALISQLIANDSRLDLNLNLLGANHSLVASRVEQLLSNQTFLFAFVNQLLANDTGLLNRILSLESNLSSVSNNQQFNATATQLFSLFQLLLVNDSRLDAAIQNLQSNNTQFGTTISRLLSNVSSLATTIQQMQLLSNNTELLATLQQLLANQSYLVNTMNQLVVSNALITNEISLLTANTSYLTNWIGKLLANDTNLASAISNLESNNSYVLNLLSQVVTNLTSVQSFVGQHSLQIATLFNRVDVLDSNYYHLEADLNASIADNLAWRALLLANDTTLSLRLDYLWANITLLSQRVYNLSAAIDSVNATTAGLTNLVSIIQVDITQLYGNFTYLSSNLNTTNTNVAILNASFVSFGNQATSNITSLQSAFAILNTSFITSNATLSAALNIVFDRLTLLEALINGLSAGGNDSTALFLTLQTKLTQLTLNVTNYVSQLTATDNYVLQKLVLIDSQISNLYVLVNTTNQNVTNFRMLIDAIQLDLDTLDAKVSAFFATVTMSISILQTKSHDLQHSVDQINIDIALLRSNLTANVTQLNSTINSVNQTLFDYADLINSRVTLVNTTLSTALLAYWSDSNLWFTQLMLNDSSLSSRIDALSTNQTSIWLSIYTLQQQLLFAIANDSSSSLAVSTQLANLEVKLLQLQTNLAQNLTLVWANDSTLDQLIRQVNASLSTLGTTMNQTIARIDSDIATLFSLSNDSFTRDVGLQTQINSLVSQVGNTSLVLTSTQQWLAGNVTQLSNRIDALNSSLASLQSTVSQLATNQSTIRDNLSNLTTAHFAFEAKFELWFQWLLTNDSTLNTRTVELIANDSILLQLIQSLNSTVSSSATAMNSNISNWIHLLLINDTSLRLAIESTQSTIVANYTAVIGYIDGKLSNLTRGVAVFTNINLGNGRIINASYFDALESGIFNINQTVNSLVVSDQQQNAILVSTGIDINNLQTNITTLLAMIQGLNSSLTTASIMINLLFQNDTLMQQFDFEKLHLLLEMSNNITAVINKILNGATAFTTLNLNGKLYTSATFDAMNQSIITTTDQAKVDLTALIIGLLAALTNGTTQFNAVNLNGNQLTTQNFTNIVDAFNTQLQAILNGTTVFTTINLGNGLVVSKTTFDNITTQFQLVSGNLTLLQTTISGIQASLSQLQSFANNINATLQALSVTVSLVNSTLISQVLSTNDLIAGLRNGSVQFSAVNVGGTLILPTTISDIYSHVTNTVAQLTNGTTTFSKLSFGSSVSLNASFVTTLVSVRQGTAVQGSILVYNGTEWVARMPFSLDISFKSANMTSLLFDNVDYTLRIKQALNMNATSGSYGCVVFWSNSGQLSCLQSGVSNTTRFDNLLRRADTYTDGIFDPINEIEPPSGVGHVLACVDHPCTHQKATSLYSTQRGIVRMLANAGLTGGPDRMGFVINDIYNGMELSFFFTLSTQVYYVGASNVYLENSYDPPADTTQWHMINVDTSRRGYWMEHGTDFFSLRSVFSGQVMRTHIYFDVPTSTTIFEGPIRTNTMQSSNSQPVTWISDTNTFVMSDGGTYSTMFQINPISGVMTISTQGNEAIVFLASNLLWNNKRVVTSTTNNALNVIVDSLAIGSSQFITFTGGNVQFDDPVRAPSFTAVNFIRIGDDTPASTNTPEYIYTGAKYCPSVSSSCRPKFITYADSSLTPSSAFGLGVALGTQFLTVPTGNTHSFAVGGTKILSVTGTGAQLEGCAVTTCQSGILYMGNPMYTNYIGSSPGLQFTIGGGGVRVRFEDKISFVSQAAARIELTAAIDRFGILDDKGASGNSFFFQHTRAQYDGYSMLSYNLYIDTNAEALVRPNAGKCAWAIANDNTGSNDILIVRYFCGLSKLGEMYRIDWTPANPIWRFKMPVAFDSSVSFSGQLPLAAVSARYTSPLYNFLDTSGYFDTGTGFPFEFYETGMLKTIQFSTGYSMRCTLFPACTPATLTAYAACISALTGPSSAQNIAVGFGSQTAAVVIYRNGPTSGLCITIRLAIAVNQYLDLSTESFTLSWVTQ